MEKQLTPKIKARIRAGSNTMCLFVAAFAVLEYCGYRFSNGLTISGYTPIGIWFWEILVLKHIRAVAALGAIIIFLVIRGYIGFILKSSLWETRAMLLSGKRHLLWGILAIIVFELLVFIVIIRK